MITLLLIISGILILTCIYFLFELSHQQDRIDKNFDDIAELEQKTEKNSEFIYRLNIDISSLKNVNINDLYKSMLKNRHCIIQLFDSVHILEINSGFKKSDGVAIVKKIKEVFGL